MRKRAGDFSASSARARQKPVRCTTITARRLNDKNADMDCHAVPPPAHKAGGDSKREELCQQDPQTFTIMATGAAPSSRRQEAMRDPLHPGEGKVFPQTNTDGEQYIRKSDDPAKASKLRTRRNRNSTLWCGRDRVRPRPT